MATATKTRKSATKKRATKAEADDVSPFLVAGDTGLKGYRGHIVDDPLPELHGRRGMEAYRKMGDNSPIVGAYVWLVETMLRSAEMSIEAAEEDQDVPLTQAAGFAEAAERERRYVESVYKDMLVDWEQHVGETSGFALYGWSACEPIYKFRRGDNPMTGDAEADKNPLYASNHDDGRVGIADLAPRSQDSLDEWDIADDGTLLGMRQRVDTKGVSTYIPGWKLYLFHARENKRSPEGRSALRSAYTSQRMIDMYLPLEGIGAERDLAGMPVMELPWEYMRSDATPQQAAVRAHFADKVRSVRRDALEGLVVPTSEDARGKTGFKFSLLTSGGTGRVQLGEVIKRLESRVLISVLAEFILVAMEGVGAKSSAETKTDLAMQALISYTRAIDRVHTRRIIPDLMRTNGVPRHLWPTLKMGRIESTSLVEIGQFIAATVGAGAIVPDRETEKYLRELADLPVGSLDVPEIRTQPATLPEMDDAAPTPAAPAADDAAPPADSGGPKAETALNGAQVTALLEIVGQVVNGQIPRDTGVQMMTLAFGFGEARANQLLGSAGAGFKPDIPPPTTNAPDEAPAPSAPALP